MKMWGNTLPVTSGDRHDRVDLLFSALRFNQGMKSLSELRMVLMSDPEALQRLVTTADRRMLLSALLSCLQNNKLLECDGGQADPLLRQLSSAQSDFSARRKVLKDGLVEIIKALNARDIVPMLLKGSVSLWKASPSWRFQRDIDFLVEPGQAAAAQKVLLSLGFEPMANKSKQPHHMQPVIRSDVPASIEVHFAASNPRGDRYLPTSQFWMSGERLKSEMGTAFLPSPIDQMLHIVVHGQISNRNAAFGVLSLKHLYEFAWEVENSTVEKVMLMYERARQIPRLLTAVDFWLAAIQSEFGVNLPVGLIVQADAISRWQRHRTRMLQDELPNSVTAYWEESSMIRARTGKMSGIPETFLAPLRDILTAPMWRHIRRQARK